MISYTYLPPCSEKTEGKIMLGSREDAIPIGSIEKKIPISSPSLYSETSGLPGVPAETLFSSVEPSKKHCALKCCGEI